MSAALEAQTLGAAGSAIYDNINAASSPDILDNIARTVWHDWGKGAFTDDEASFLTCAIDKRRPVTFHRSARAGTGPSKPIGRLLGRLGSRFTSRRPQRSPDRKKSRERRRTLGGSSALPPNIRHYYTEGERAVLCIVSGEVKRQGVCDWPIDKIAAEAGVSRTTVQNALSWAQRLGHVMVEQRPVRGRRSLTNVVRVVSLEWRTWIKRGPSMARSIGFKTFYPTKIIDRKQEATNEELQGTCRAPPRSPPPAARASAA
jgi:hypothetical protein